MNGVTQNGYLMHDPYVRGSNDPWAAAPNTTITQGQSNTLMQHQMNAQSNMQNAVPMPSQSPADDSERFQHGLSQQVIGNPLTVEEAYLGSMQAMLAREIGSHIAATFLVGTAQLLRSEGQLTEVGNNYITIYQADRDRYVVGDLNSLRFVEFFEDSSMRNALQTMDTLSSSW